MSQFYRDAERVARACGSGAGCEVFEAFDKKQKISHGSCSLASKVGTFRHSPGDPEATVKSGAFYR